MKIVIPEKVSNTTSSVFTRSSQACYLDYRGFYRIADINEPRYNYRYLDDNYELGYGGLLIEPYRQNIWTNNATINGNYVTFLNVTTRTITIPNTALGFVFSFYGEGSVKVEYTNTHDGYVNDTLVGTGSNQRVWKAYGAGAGLNVTFTVSGTVNRPQIEPIGFETIFPSGISEDAIVKYAKPTSWIPCVGSTPSYRKEENITSNGIFRNDFVETTEDYNQAQEYFADDLVKYDNNIFESITDNNIGNIPTLEETDLNWNFVKASNDTAFFDALTDSVSTIQGDGYFSYVIKDKHIDTATLLQLQGHFAEMCITQYSSLGTISEFNQLILPSPTSNNSMYLEIPKQTLYPTGDYGTIISFCISSEINIDTEEPIDPTAEVSVGELIFGISEDIGKSLKGLSTSIIDYSLKSTNTFGTTTFVKRGFSKRVSGDILITGEEQNRVINKVYDVRATPILWVFTEDSIFNSSTIVFGIYNSFNLKIDYPDYQVYNIEIESLVL